MLRFTLTILILGLNLCGCELFSTREPESPTGSSGEGWQFPTTPDMVLDNMESAVGRRSEVDYMRSFVASDGDRPEFTFTPDPETAVNFPGVFSEWDRDSEQKYVQALFASSNLPLDSLAVLSFQIDREDLSGDTVNISSRYELHLGHVRPHPAHSFQGRSDFRMIRDRDGGWYVQHWEDFRTGSEACWSDLKAQF